MSDDGREQEPFEPIERRGLRGRLKRRRHREPTFRERLLAMGFKEGDMKQGETLIMFGFKRIAPTDGAAAREGATGDGDEEAHDETN